MVWKGLHLESGGDKGWYCCRKCGYWSVILLTSTSNYLQGILNDLPHKSLSVGGEPRSGRKVVE